MALDDNQVKEIKDHLLKQLDNFPEDKRVQMKSQIEGMSNDEVENFVHQNNLGHLGGKCIFCEIISGKVPTIKIAENDENIAALELNPLSKGHTLIIPKKHLDHIEDKSKTLAIQVAERLRQKFRPQDVHTKELEIMGHKLLEVIPLYGNETERRKASEAELNAVKEEILRKHEEDVVLDPKKQSVSIPKLPPKIP